MKYFTFHKSKELQSIWVSKCKRQDKINVKTARICETHFKNEDFERDLKNELLGLPIVKHLLKTAIPSLKIPGEKRKSETLVSRQIRYEKREKKDRMELIDSLFENSETEPAKDPEEFPEDNLNNISTETKRQIYNSSVQCNLTSHLDDQIKTMTTELNKKAAETQLLKKKLKRLKSEKYKKAIVRKYLEQSHSPAQARCIMNKKAKYQRGYNKEDIINALVIKSSSSKIFKFLKAKKLLPLPSVQTQEKYLKDFKLL